MAKELAAQKAFLQGCDSLGRAVVVVLAAKHYTRSRDFEVSQGLRRAKYPAAADMAVATRGPAWQACWLGACV